MTRLFVYGTLKRGCCRSHVLRDQRFLAEARTAPKYRMYDTGHFPALVEVRDGLCIEGEIWEVDPACLRILDGLEGVPSLYERRSVVLEDASLADVETYIFRQRIDGLADVGCCWHDKPSLPGGESPVATKPLYVVDSLSPTFARARSAVHIVCAGDSITGWNNFGSPDVWPFPTYPTFLQLLWAPREWRVADGGIAGEISDNGPAHVRRYLSLFPNARYYVVGFGTNDLGTWPALETTSWRIMENLRAMVSAICDRGKQPVVLNVPYVKESALPVAVAKDTHARRDYHNARVKEFCEREGIPLADICSRLRDPHFGDELHPNDLGAKMIAEEVFRVLI